MTGTAKASMAKYIKPEVKSAARMLGYCLTLDTRDSWWGLVPVLTARLTEPQRVSLAFMALKSCDPENAELTASAALGWGAGAGAPLPPFLSYTDEAAWWADIAAPAEIEAYCLATYNRMRPDRQSAFLDYVQGRMAA